MKTVLFIAYYYPPLGGAGVHRSLKFTRYLPEHGWSPIVIAAHEGVKYSKDYSLLEQIPDTVDVHRVAYRAPRCHKLLDLAMAKMKFRYDFPDNVKNWIQPAYKAAQAILQGKKADVIFSTSLPYSAHFVAAKLKREFDIPWVADFRDPWSGNAITNAYLRDALLAPLYKRVAARTRRAEADILHHADKTTVTSWDHRRRLCEAFGLRDDKVEVIPNGYDEADVTSVQPTALYPNRTTITYLGSFYHGYRQVALDLLDVLRDLPKRVELVVIGKAAAAMHDVNSTALTCINNLPKEKATMFAAGSDFLLAMFAHGFMGVPGKLYEYLRLGKPILAIVPENSDAATVIRKAGAGYVLSPDKETMRAQLTKIMGDWERDKGTTRTPDMEYIAQFERKRLTAKLADVLTRVVSASDRSATGIRPG